MFDYPTMEIDYEQLKSIDINSMKSSPFSLVVNRESVKYEFIIKINRNSPQMLCFGSGAYNPQNSIIKHNSNFINDLLSTAYGMYDDNIINENLYRISVTECMKKYNNVPKIFYIQNISHAPDMERQTIPFIEKMRHIDHTKNINSIFYYDEIAGHNSISKKDTINLIKDIMNGKYLKILELPIKLKK